MIFELLNPSCVTFFHKSNEKVKIVLGILDLSIWYECYLCANVGQSFCLLLECLGPF